MPKPSNNRLEGTADEFKAVAQGVLAYFGTYSLDDSGKTLTQHIQSSSFPNFDGANRPWAIALTDDDLRPASDGRRVGAHDTDVPLFGTGCHSRVENPRRPKVTTLRERTFALNSLSQRGRSTAALSRRALLRYGAVGISALVLPPILVERLARAQGAVESLDQLLEPIRARYGVPALGGAFSRDSGLVAIGTVGLRRAGTNERVQSNDLFEIGSCTKSMTATLIAMLVEQRKLSWETTVADIFPDLIERIHPGYQKVTLRQLLSHRAGLPEDDMQGPGVWPQIVAMAGPLNEQRRELLEVVLAEPPVAEPGTAMIYTNFAYVIAGAFAERATGEEWEVLMQQMLFAPLGMTTAGFGPPGLDQPWGHMGEECQPLGPGPEADIPPVIGPAATVHCSMADWARYATLHLRGAHGEEGLLLRPETFRQLHADSYRQGYALGWVVIESDRLGGVELTHAGATGQWYAEIIVAPGHNLAFMVAANCGSEGGLRACNSTMNAMIRRYL